MSDRARAGATQGMTAMVVVGVMFGISLCSLTASAAPPRLTAPPALLSGDDPLYPPELVAAGIGGDVVLHIVIDDHGDVDHVDVISAPDGALAWAALGAATTFRFTPARFCLDTPDGRDGGRERCDVPLPVAVDWHLGFAPPEPLPPPDSTTTPTSPPTMTPTTTPGNAPGTASLRGRVRETGSGLPILGVDVVATARTARSASSGGAERESVSDDDGAFVMADLAPGGWRLAFSTSGYEPALIDVELVAGVERSFVVQLSPAGGHELIIHGAVVAYDDDRMRPAVVLDQQALRGSRGEPLAEAIADVPGVAILDSGPQAKKPVLHGQFGRRLLLLDDGVRHEAQDWGLDHAPEVDPFGAEQVTVVSGPSGVRYGPDAVGGAVLLDPGPLRTTPGVNGRLDVVGGLNGLQGAIAGRVDAGASFLPGLALRVEANLQKAAAASTPDYVLGNTGSEVGNVGATVGYGGDVFGHDVDVSLSVRRYHAVLGVCFCQLAATPEVLAALARSKTAPPQSGAWLTTYDIERPRQEVTHDLLLARVATDVVDAGRMTLSYTLQRDLRLEFDQVRQATKGPQYTFDLVTHGVDAVFAHRTVPLTSGARVNGEAGLHADVQRHQFTGLLLVPGYERESGGVFALERLTFDDVVLGDVDVEAGARVDGLLQTAVLGPQAHASLVRRGQVDANACDVAGEVAGVAGVRCDTSYRAATGTVGARWKIDLPRFPQALTLSLDLSSATRFPDADELYLGGRAPSLPVFGLGDARLGPETTRQATASAALSLPWVDVDAAAFVADVDDYIVFGPDFEGGQPAVTVVASGAFPRFSYRAVDARFVGADLAVVAFKDALFSAAASGSFVNGLDLTTGGYLPFVPPPRGRLSLSSNLGDLALFQDLRLSVSATGIARQQRSDARSDFAPPPDGVVLVGASASTTLPLSPFLVHVRLDGDNLLDTPYRDSLSLLRFFVDQPGRAVWLRLQIEL